MDIGRTRSREQSDITNTSAALDEEKKIAGTVERWFHNQPMARLETQLPRILKQDLNHLKDTFDPDGSGVKRTANRLIVEALVDLFKKYEAGDGDMKLIEELDFKGEY